MLIEVTEGQGQGQTPLNTCQGLQLMTPRPALTPLRAAQALAGWWEMAGLEPFDLDGAIRSAQRVTTPFEVKSDPKAAQLMPSTRARPASARRPTDSLEDAQKLAAACSSIEALTKAVAGFDGCSLKSHARNLVFADGMAGAPVMIIGEAPDRYDDETGLPFSGPNGQLLDKMLASIGLNRITNCYLAPLLPWRPPGDRKPTAEEIAICRPFIARHIELAAPKAILMVGGLAAQSLLDVSDSVMKLRNRALTYDAGQPIYAQCVLSPAYLISRPAEKALMWNDLLRFEAEISVRGVALSL
jgi:uracil-DNA glycosylase